MELVNHYSIIWTAVFAFAIAAVIVFRKGIQPRRGIILLGIAALLFIGWLVIRPPPAITAEYPQFQARLGQGQVILLELQSPF